MCHPNCMRTLGKSDNTEQRSVCERLCQIIPTVLELGWCANVRWRCVCFQTHIRRARVCWVYLEQRPCVVVNAHIVFRTCMLHTCLCICATNLVIQTRVLTLRQQVCNLWSNCFRCTGNGRSRTGVAVVLCNAQMYAQTRCDIIIICVHMSSAPATHHSYANMHNNITGKLPALMATRVPGGRLHTTSGHLQFN